MTSAGADFAAHGLIVLFDKAGGARRLKQIRNLPLTKIAAAYFKPWRTGHMYGDAVEGPAARHGMTNRAAAAAFARSVLAL